MITTPVAAGDRNSLLDGMRGCALLGIMFVNMTWFTGFAVLSGEQRAAFATEALDDVVYWLINALVDRKFWSLFSLLFGVGVAMQYRRAVERDAAFAPRFVLRMATLLVIGAAHAVFVWFGDIVSLYAVTGVWLLLFLRARETTLLIWAIVLLASPMAIRYFYWSTPPHGPYDQLGVFAGGTLVETFEINWVFVKYRWWRAVYMGRFPALLGMFLLGVLVGRRGIIDEPSNHLRLLVALLLVTLPIGLAGNAFYAIRPPGGGMSQVQDWLCTAVPTIAVPVLTIAWACAIVLVGRTAIGATLLRPFTLVGRMSLTSYIMQSIVGVVLFYGCGFGLWAKFGITWTVLLILAIFAAQVLFSAVWLSVFQQGPVEWVWRCLTYGRLLPLRKAIG